MSFDRTGVVGAGTMGLGIAQVLAVSGRHVQLVDVSSPALDRALSSIGESLGKFVEKGMISGEEKGAALARIKPSTDLASVAGSGLVVEVVVEDLATKESIFVRLQDIVSPNTVLASNSSAISITELARKIENPGRVVGMHFMNPVPLMGLVEIVRGVNTTDETIHSIETLSMALDKQTVIVNDYPGFVSNRILVPMINEAVFCLMEGVADRDSIDTVMRVGMSHPKGPLALADLIGLDVILRIMEVLHHGFGDPKYRPCPLLRNMVAAGKLGRKSGEGFYEY